MSRLVEAHHGTISLESAIGKGSIFSIRLPLHQPDESLCPSAVESSRVSFEVRACSSFLLLLLVTPEHACCRLDLLKPTKLRQADCTKDGTRNVMALSATLLAGCSWNLPILRFPIHAAAHCSTCQDVFWHANCSRQPLFGRCMSALQVQDPVIMQLGRQLAFRQ